MLTVPKFEEMLINSGFTLLKYYLDIDKAEQTRRLKNRATDPLKQWKTSPIDKQALKYWTAYSKARNEMLARTHNAATPWTVVRSNDKHLSRLNIIKDALNRLHYKDKDDKLTRPDARVVFTFDASCLENGLLAK